MKINTFSQILQPTIEDSPRNSEQGDNSHNNYIEMDKLR